MESLDVVSVLRWVADLPLKTAVGLALAYALVLIGRRVMDYIVAKGSQNPEKELRADLLKAHRELRRELRSLKKDLAEAYDEARSFARELQTIRENLSAIRADIHRFRVEYPEAEPVLRIIGNRLDQVHVEAA